MKGSDVREVFEAILPDDALMELVKEARFQQRTRKLNALELFRSAILAASKGEAGRQSAVIQSYLESGNPKVVRGAAYGWFSPKFETVMEGIRDRALQYVSTQPLDVPGWLREVADDWHIVDTTGVHLDDSLADVYPGGGIPAGLKLHKRYSVGIGTTVDYHFYPAREQESSHFALDESWHGLGLLADLGYASIQLLRDAEKYGVKFVIRLKTNWKPKVDRLVRGTLKGPLVKGSDLDVMLEEDLLVLDGTSIDADVTVGRSRDPVTCRMVATEFEEGQYSWYLTNLPRRIGVRQVGQLYRVRWEIEMDNKLNKSCFRLDEIGAKSPHTVRALLHASMVSSIIVGLLAHKHRLAEGTPSKGTTKTRTKPPIHPQAMAKMLSIMGRRTSQALLMTGKEADAEWQDIADLLVHVGQDPNWRRRPSVLDELRGWKRKPAKPRRPKRKATK